MGNLIGLIVIISQTVVTTIVLLGFSFLYFGLYFPLSLLSYILIYDIFAIVMHMLYRRYERKKKGEREESVHAPSKELIIFHSITSALALLIAFLFLRESIDGLALFFVLSLWFSSFISGIFLYIKKYSVF